MHGEEICRGCGGDPLGSSGWQSCAPHALCDEDFQEGARALHGIAAPCVGWRCGSVIAAPGTHLAAHMCPRFCEEIGLKNCSQNNTFLRFRESGDHLVTMREHQSSSTNSMSAVKITLRHVAFLSDVSSVPCKRISLLRLLHQRPRRVVGL